MSSNWFTVIYGICEPILASDGKLLVFITVSFSIFFSFFLFCLCVVLCEERSTGMLLSWWEQPNVWLWTFVLDLSCSVRWGVDKVKSSFGSLPIVLFQLHCMANFEKRKRSRYGVESKIIRVGFFFLISYRRNFLKTWGSNSLART